MTSRERFGVSGEIGALGKKADLVRSAHVRPGFGRAPGSRRARHLDQAVAAALGKTAIAIGNWQENTLPCPGVLSIWRCAS